MEGILFAVVGSSILLECLSVKFLFLIHKMKWCKLGLLINEKCGLKTSDAKESNIQVKFVDFPC